MIATARRSRGWLVLAASAIAYLIFILTTRFVVDGVTHFVLIDDAMISMRFAKNLADGHGLVWNAGQPPVEGYTNLLWTLWMALIHLTGVPPAKTSLVVSLSGVPLLLLTAWLSAGIAERLTGSRSAGTLTLAAVAFYYPLVYWTLRGTEVGAIALAVVYGSVLALRLAERRSGADLALFALAATAAILLRMDSVVPFAVLAAAVVLWRPAPERPALAVVLAATLAVPLFAHGVFSLRYYGSFLPNTYYLKMTGVPLAARLSRGGLFLVLVTLRHLYPALVLAALTIGGGGWRGRRDPRWLLAALVAGQAAYSIYVGGDAWESYGFSNRYVAVALPALLVLASIGLDQLLRPAAAGARRRVAGVLLGLTAVKVALEWAFVAFNRNVDFDLQFFYRDHRAVLIPVLTVTVVTLAAAAIVAWRPGLERTPSHGHESRAAIVWCAAIWLLMNGQPLALWIGTRGGEARYDARMARAGLLIKAATRPDAVMASARAGAVTYFSDRCSLDLLGKSDPVIARMHPVAPFKPGHDRWDYEKSIGEGRPDVVVELWLPTQRDFGFLAATGYVQLANRLYVRRDSPRVDFAAIERGLD